MRRGHYCSACGGLGHYAPTCPRVRQAEARLRAVPKRSLPARGPSDAWRRSPAWQRPAFWEPPRVAEPPAGEAPQHPLEQHLSPTTKTPSVSLSAVLASVGIEV